MRDKAITTHEGLIKAVGDIDPEAGHYIAHAAPASSRWFRPDRHLAKCFAWSDTPQGYGYWRSINDYLLFVTQPGGYAAMTQ